MVTLLAPSHQLYVTEKVDSSQSSTVRLTAKLDLQDMPSSRYTVNEGIDSEVYSSH